MPATTELPPARRAKDNERPLVEDIRLLGRILGDVIREQEGKEAFELIERVRQLSVDQLEGLLAFLLADHIAEDEGKEAFELIERVRQLSVAYRLKRDASAGRVLD